MAPIREGSSNRENLRDNEYFLFSWTLCPAGGPILKDFLNFEILVRKFASVGLEGLLHIL